MAQTPDLCIFRVYSPTFNPPTWIRDAAFAYLALLTDNRKGRTSQIKISLPGWSVHFRHQATRIGIILVGKISIYASLWSTCWKGILLRRQKDRGKPSAQQDSNLYLLIMSQVLYRRDRNFVALEREMMSHPRRGRIREKVECWSTEDQGLRVSVRSIEFQVNPFQLNNVSLARLS